LLHFAPVQIGSSQMSNLKPHIANCKQQTTRNLVPPLQRFLPHSHRRGECRVQRCAVQLKPAAFELIISIIIKITIVSSRHP
jgi:hypothetical protein